MHSTMEKELVHLDNGCFTLKPKKLPNYCGIENVGFIWHGEWSDPELEYNGKRCNIHDVEDSMWNSYTEDNPEPDYRNRKEYAAYEDGFTEYVKVNADSVYELIEGVGAYA